MLRVIAVPLRRFREGVRPQRCLSRHWSTEMEPHDTRMRRAQPRWLRSIRSRILGPSCISPIQALLVGHVPNRGLMAALRRRFYIHRIRGVKLTLRANVVVHANHPCNSSHIANSSRRWSSIQLRAWLRTSPALRPPAVSPHSRSAAPRSHRGSAPGPSHGRELTPAAPTPIAGRRRAAARTRPGMPGSSRPRPDRRCGPRRRRISPQPVRG